MSNKRKADGKTEGAKWPALIAAKLHVPRLHPRYIKRNRLSSCLDEAAQEKLTAVIAPAGYGKTAAVADWAGEREPSAGWVALDPSDNRPVNFWRYVSAALEPALPGIRGSLLSALRSSNFASLEEAVGLLLEKTEGYTGEFTLVLDDFHLITEPAVHESLAFFLRHIPDNLNAVLISRTERPVFPLLQSRLKGRLKEIRAGALRFTEDEALAYLAPLLPDRELSQLRALYSRTEGWAYGLKLAAEIASGHGTGNVRGDERRFSDYFAEEVLRPWPQEVQAFLFTTSFLDRLSGPLCDAVTGQDRSEDLLEELAASGVFMEPLDADYGWYRYHPLFAGYLRYRLAKTHRGELPRLHRGAGEWFEQNGLLREAAHHFLQAGDYPRAAGLVEQVAPAMLKDEEKMGVLSAWVKALPGSLVYGSGLLCLCCAYAAALQGQVEEAEDWAEKAAAAVNQQKEQQEGTLPAEGAAPAKNGGPSRPKGIELEAELALFRAYLALVQGDFPRVFQLAEEGSAQMKGQSIFKESGLALNLKGYSLLTGPLGFYGHLSLLPGESDRLTKEIIQVAIPGCYLGVLHAELLYEQNALDRVLPVLIQGIEEAMETGAYGALVPAFFLMARLHCAQGDLAGAFLALGVAERKLEQEGQTQWLPLFDALRARLMLQKGEMEGVEQWVEKTGLRFYDRIRSGCDYELLTLARALMKQHKNEEALLLLERLLLFARKENRLPCIIEILNLQALAYGETGETVKALDTLEGALLLGQKEGYRRSFIDEGPPLQRLLQKLVRRCSRGKLSEETTIPLSNRLAYMQVLLRCLKEEKLRLARVHSAQPPDYLPDAGLPLEPLTSRELQVLRLLAEELSNSEIAERLSITLDTVKVHNRNIYYKLDVRSRYRAVDRARELGML